jgi:hypothetical protein
MTTKRPAVRFGVYAAASALCLAASARLYAQAVTPAKPTQPASDQAGVTPDNTAEETILLTPFTVDAAEDKGSYRATSTLAGTRVRTELQDVASAISVVTAQFLQDTGAKNTQDLLVYTTNTEVGGIQGNFSGVGGSTSYNEAANLLRPNESTRVRGLASADNTRDYFLTEIPWDGYIVDRVDLQRGPNSILFGVGSPGGIVNTSLNTAGFKNANKVENRFGRFGSMRWSGDFNYVIIPNELSVRVALLDDETKYQQESAFNHDKRVFAALRYEPKLFDFGRTTLRVNFEKGDVSANRPRSLPPVDGITPWFRTGTSNGIANMNKLTLNPVTSWDQWSDNPNLYPNRSYPWLATMGRLFSSNIAYYYDGTQSGPLMIQSPNLGTGFGRSSTGMIDGTISAIEFGRPYAVATFNGYATSANIPGGRYYANTSLSDATVFDFYNKLIDGDNKREWQGWESSNIALQQTFFNDRVGFEAVYDYQRYDDGQIGFFGDGVLSVDINTHLMDGRPNPNVGRPFVSNSGQYGNREDYISRDNLRFTSYVELRAEDYLDKSSWLTRLLGRHVITGLLSEDLKRTDARGFSRWASEPAFAEQNNFSTDLTTGGRQLDWIAYVGPSLANRSSASGANLNAITARINPSGYANVRYFDSHWNPPAGVNFGDPFTYSTYDVNGNLVPTVGTQADNPANYVGWRTQNFRLLNYDNPADVPSLYTSGQKGRNRIKSRGVTWQAYLWDGVFVPVFGWRRDEVDNASSQAPKGPNNISLMDYTVDRSFGNTRFAAGESKSWGGVLHTPRAWRDKLPFNTHFSLFYNRSSNFKADAPRGDIFGTQIDNPAGRTKDYGFVMSTLEDRLSLKVTWYETKVKNANLGSDNAGFSGNLYYVWALPYWGATHALAALDGIASPQLRQGDWGWPWNGIATLPDGSPDTVRIGAIVTDFFRNFPLDQRFADEYGLGLNVAAMRAATTPAQAYAAVPTYGVNGQGASNLGLQPAFAGNLRSFGTGPQATVDTTSKGIEFELTAQPTKNWNITANASKTKATRDAISPSIDRWIETYTKFLAGDAGLIRLWGGDPIRTVWKNNILGPYAVLKGQLGSSAPEIAPWRFNVVTNYSFSSGPLNGVNTGLAYRWEDKRILGYKYNPTTDTLDNNQPWHGPSDDHVDLWVGYQRKITNRIDWRIQLNLRNVGEKANLQPVTIQPNGDVAVSRIREGMVWQLTNTFSF